MADFKTKLDKATTGEGRSVLGAVAMAVGRDGATLLNHASGKISLTADAQPITPDSILALASCTKLILSVGALRLVQSNNLSLDSPSLIETHLPELTSQPVLTNAPNEAPKPSKREKPITLRHLLSHTSGSGADFMDPKLQAWRRSRSEEPQYFTAALPDAVATPLIFEPGEGWSYGAGLDWVGLLIERVTGRTLGEFLRAEVFDVVGCDERIGFDRKALDGRFGVVQTVTPTKKAGGDGEAEGVDLVPYPYPPAEQKSERGGGGLYASPANYVKILADLIAPSPKLLTPSTLQTLFAPQFAQDSTPLTALHAVAPMLTAFIGPLVNDVGLDGVNHALGGVVLTGDNERLGRTKGTMMWAGALNCLWFVNLEVGFAGFYGSCMFPPGAGGSGELMTSFVEGVWKTVGKGEEGK